jgi:hypothetical protein
MVGPFGNRSHNLLFALSPPLWIDGVAICALVAAVFEGSTAALWFAVCLACLLVGHARVLLILA